MKASNLCLLCAFVLMSFLILTKDTYDGNKYPLTLIDQITNIVAFTILGISNYVQRGQQMNIKAIIILFFLCLINMMTNTILSIMEDMNDHDYHRIPTSLALLNLRYKDIMNICGRVKLLTDIWIFLSIAYYCSKYMLVALE